MILPLGLQSLKCLLPGPLKKSFSAPSLDSESVSGDGADRLLLLEVHGWCWEHSQNAREAHLEIMRIETWNVAMSNTHQLW